jgi:hypothetical protein
VIFFCILKIIKRLQAETPVNHTGLAPAELDALLPAILDRGFTG